MSGNYILKDGEPVEEPDMLTWGRWMEEHRHERKVARAEDLPEEAFVSTVFLGLDHGWDGEALLFETMVFGGALDGEQDRYATREEALAGHSAMVARVAEGEPTDAH